jgi:hypothetical protein
VRVFAFLEHTKLTVSTTDSSIDYLGNGVTAAFPVPFRFLRNEDLVVSSVAADGTDTPLVMGANYTVVGAGSQTGGAVMLTTPPLAGITINISRVLSPVQSTDLRNQGRFYAETHESVFDYLTMLVQQVLTYIGRALLRPPGKNYFDAKGLPISNVADPKLPQDAATKGWVGRYVDSVSGLINTTLGIAYDAGTLFDFLKYGVSRNVDSIAALKAIASARNQRVFVLGYYAKGDGGGGVYYADPADTTSADNNVTVIVGADGTRWKLKLGSVIDANQAGIMGDGVDRTARMLALRDLIAGMTVKPELVYSCSASGGNYVYSQSANYAIPGFVMSRRGEVTFTNTGTGYAFILDGGTTGKVGNFRICSEASPLIIRGGASSGGGVYMRAIVEDFGVHVHCHGCGTAAAALRTEWVVSGVIDVVATPMDRSTGALAWYQGGKPAAGWSLGQRNAGEQTCYNIFLNGITNACSIGKYFQNTLGNLILGGDTEYSTGQGILTEAGALNDLFLKHNFEVNGLDLSANGYCMEFVGCDSVNIIIGPASKFIQFRGGNHDAININTGALNTVLDGVKYSRGLGASTITDNGTKTRRSNCVNMSTGKVENQPKSVTALTVTMGTWTYTNDTGNVVGIHTVGGTFGAATLYEAGQAMVLPLPAGTGGTQNSVAFIQPEGQYQLTQVTALPTVKLIKGY